MNLDLAYCDICHRDSESVEWCGSCGNCQRHCADYVECEL
jgi:hypothetical protein